MNSLSIRLLKATILLSFTTFGQLNYSDTYKEEFRETIEFYNSNKKQFSKASKNVDLNPEFIFSIVAPEISQFNTVINDVELYSLKVLYTQFGKDYSDFSVGYFQMKPSFIESLEKYIDQHPKYFKDYKHILFKNPNSKNSRIERLERLNTLDWQLKYLTLFCAVVEYRFKNSIYKNSEDKLKFFSTAYNSGFEKSKEQLTIMEFKRFFPKIGVEKYNYSDISVSFYKEIRK
jgi:hypothetical protein